MITIEPATQSYVETEINKLCGKEQIKQIFNGFSQNCTWKVEDIIRTLIHACIENTSIEDVCTSKKLPSADTVHRRLAKLSLDSLDNLTNEWIQDIASRVHFHQNTKITVAFDLHEVPFYGNNDKEWIIGMKRKAGTSYAFKFLTATISTGTIRLPVAVIYLTKERHNRISEYVQSIINDLQLWIDIELVLLDRGFCSNEIVEFLEFRELKYVMAAVRHFDIKEAAKNIETTVKDLASQSGVDIEDDHKLGKWARKNKLDEFFVDYVSTGKNLHPTRLVAVYVRQRTNNKDPLKRWTYCLFLYITNLKCSGRYIVKRYAKRWIIETDYRCIGVFEAVSNSRIPQTRILLFSLSMALDALWVIASTLSNLLKKGNDISITEETLFNIFQSNSLIFTGRWFKRFIRTEIMPLQIISKEVA
jgi:hypothetical protein